MTEATKIWNDAKNSPQTYRGQTAMSNGNYNINYMLSHDQIQIASLLNISKSKDINFNEATKTCFIDGISIQDTVSISIDTMEAFFGESIKNAVINTKKGLPSFLSVDNGKHFVLISLLPSTTNPNELSIVYTNSIPQDTTAKPFADSLVKYLKSTGVNVVNNGYVEMSQDQQVGNCCGLSVADNIASIFSHHYSGKDINSIKDSLFTPRNLEDKKTYYQNFGQELFQKLNQHSTPNYDDLGYESGEKNNPPLKQELPQTVQDKVFDILESNDQEETKNPASSSLMQPFIIDATQLEYLLKKYKDQLNSIKTSTNIPDKEKALTQLNIDLFNKVKDAGQILPINKINQSPDGTFITELQGNNDVSYSRIGDENGNNLTMAETQDGKIYFDEKEQGNNNFTGIVFVDRIDANTNQLLQTKDAIHYKNGEVVNFIEGNGGNSRLGQINQFRETESKFRTVEGAQLFKDELEQAVAERNAGRNQSSMSTEMHDQSVGPENSNSRGTQNQNQDPRNRGNRPTTPPPRPDGTQQPRPTGPVVPPVVPSINSKLDTAKKDPAQELTDTVNRINLPGAGANIEDRINNPNRPDHPNQKALETRDPTQEYKDAANKVNPPGAGANIEDRINNPNRPDHPNQKALETRDPTQEYKDAANKVNPPGAGANIEDRINNPNRPDHPNQKALETRDPTQEYKDAANKINPPGAGANIEDRINNPNRPDHPNQKALETRDPTQEYKDAANKVNPPGAGANIEDRINNPNRPDHPNQKALETRDPTQEYKDAANKVNPPGAGANIEDRINNPNRPDHPNQKALETRDPTQEYKDAANKINPPGAGANIGDRMNAQKGTHTQGETGYNPDNVGFQEKLDYLKKAAGEKLVQQSQKPLETSTQDPKATAFTQTDAEKLTQQLNSIKEEIKRESVETKTASSESVKSAAKPNVWQSIKNTINSIKEEIKRESVETKTASSESVKSAAKPKELGPNSSVKDKIDYYEGLSNLSKPITPNTNPPSDKSKTP